MLFNTHLLNECVFGRLSESRRQLPANTQRLGYGKILDSVYMDQEIDVTLRLNIRKNLVVSCSRWDALT